MKPHQERLLKEYRDLQDKVDKLHFMNIKYEAGTLDFEPDCPLYLLQRQESIMREYLSILATRMIIEGVKSQD